MESRPRGRRGSKDEPPDLSELMNKLIEYANLFIRDFDNKRPKMREIVGEFQKIVDEVKKMQEETDSLRRAGVVTGGAGIGLLALGLLAAPLTGGVSLAAAAGAAAAIVVVGTNVTKMMEENETAERVEKLGEEFMKITEPSKKNLEEIKTTCETLEKKSGGFQAEDTLTGVEEFQRILRQISELGKVIEEALIVVLTVMQKIKDLSRLLVKVFRVTATPEEDQKFRDAIIKSADQCQRVVDEFDQMREKLKDLTGN